MEIDFDKILITAYGAQIENDLDEIKAKFGAVIAAHLFAGTSGDNPLCILNRALGTLINK